MYTVGLLGAPLPSMPFERGTRGFAWALLASGVALTLASLYAAAGELRGGPRSPVGKRLLVASLGTLLLGLLMLAGSAVRLAADAGLSPLG